MTGRPLSAETRQRLEAAFEKGMQVGPERTAAQDISFGLRQLTDVTDKAPTPGINDPDHEAPARGRMVCARQ